MDDWVVMTNNHHKLRQLVRQNQHIVTKINQNLHPEKTYIGKIAKDFDFLGYFFDGKILTPSKESIRRCQEKQALILRMKPIKAKKPQIATKKRKKIYVKRLPSGGASNQVTILPIISTHGCTKEAINRLELYIRKWLSYINASVKDKISKILKSYDTAQLQLNLPSNLI